MADVDVVRNDAQARYEIRGDGDDAGFAACEQTGGLIVFTQTEIDPKFKGRAHFSTQRSRRTGGPSRPG